MWTWIATLPVIWQIALPVIVLIAIVIMSMWGHAKFTWAGKVIGFGTPHNDCKKCKDLVMTKAIKYATECEIVKNSVLRDQMNYVEQKLQEICLAFTQSYREMIVSYRKPNEPMDYQREQKEYLLYQETLCNALEIIKKELRRSMKENGFFEMSAMEYASYCKSKTTTVISMEKEYVTSRYPFEGMIIPLLERFAKTDIKFIEGIIFEIFNKSKEIVLDSKEKLKQLSDKFDSDLDNLGEEE